jgi:hypothetical protein
LAGFHYTLSRGRVKWRRDRNSDRANIVTVDTPKSAATFDHLRVGDVVSLEYSDTVSVRPNPAGEPAVDRVDVPVTMPMAGTPSGATTAAPRVATGTVTGWDPAARVVRFTGPTGAADAASARCDRRQHHGRRSRLAIVSTVFPK